MPWVTGSAILQHAAASGSPSAAQPDEDWADVCAAAVNAAIDTRLDGETPGADFTAELTRSALQDGAAAYAERKAPHGVLSIGPDGDAVRLGADILRSTTPVLGRHLPTAGIGIG